MTNEHVKMLANKLKRRIAATFPTSISGEALMDNSLLAHISIFFLSKERKNDNSRQYFGRNAKSNIIFPAPYP